MMSGESRIDEKELVCSNGFAMVYSRDGCNKKGKGVPEVYDALLKGIHDDWVLCFLVFVENGL